jgi:N-acetylneuraminic acid mutarotase
MIRLIPIFFMTALACFADTLNWKQLPALPESLGVAAPFAGVTDGALLVAGGAHFPDRMPWDGGQKKWLDQVWLLAKSDGPWKEIGKLPRPLGYGVSVTHANSIICVGGSDAKQHYADCFRLTWKNNALVTESLPALPIPLSVASGALVGDVLILCCGAEQPGEQVATNRGFALDLSAKNLAWRELPPLPGKPRLLATAGACEATFYLFGGASLAPNADGKIGRQFLKEAWSFTMIDGWKRIADLPRPNLAAPAPAPFHQGKLLLLAGDDGLRVGSQPLKQHPGFPNGILAYDPKTDRWSELGAVPAPRATVPCVQWQGNFIIPSGEARPGVRSPEIWTLLGK